MKKLFQNEYVKKSIRIIALVFAIILFFIAVSYIIDTGNWDYTDNKPLGFFLLIISIAIFLFLFKTTKTTVIKFFQNEHVRKFTFYALLIIFAIIAWHVIPNILKGLGVISKKIGKFGY